MTAAAAFRTAGQAATFEAITALLDTAGASYRVVDHEPAGKSEEVAVARGTTMEQGAKALVLTDKKDVTRLFLAVLPSNLNLDKVKFGNHIGLKGNQGKSRISFASTDKVQELTGCTPGTVPPFVFNDKLKLVVDRQMANVEEIAFNAASERQSIILNTQDYLKSIGVSVDDLPDIATVS